MLNIVDQMFQYCEIPEDGQQYFFNDSIENKKIIVSAFKHNSFMSKYIYMPILSLKFVFNTEKHKRIYHYLNHENLTSILKCQYFYVGNQQEMNDSLESKYSWDLAFDLLNEKDNSNQIQKMFEEIKRRRPFDSYIWSFTLDENNMALQNYGDLAVVMNPQDTFESLARKYTNSDFENMNTGNAYILPLHVVYDYQTQVKYLSNTLDIWLDSINSGNYGDYQDASLAMYLYSLVFKSPKYHQEEEIRYVINKIPDINGNGYDIKINGKKKLEAPFLPSLCSEIIVNHKADHVKNESIDTIQTKVKSMIENYGFNNTIVRKTDLEY
ncbi:hypothetical protein CJ221_03260 [Lactobacillus gasseri]|uniref:hypothetical protein n=1 Tax=Lactobacillus gasseri TaxID=1596 RepID=UPI000C99F4D5|nr:hypothetical protein [Lactobacillus gasseri]PMC33241.1 hypothetical protein CJ221_03260 [Lactobacillus gasseri]